MQLFSVSLILVCVLNLAYSVQIVPDVEVVKYNISKDVTLQCNVKDGEGVRQNFTWQKGGQDVHTLDTMGVRVTFVEHENNATMTIVQTTEEDAGNYTCITKTGHSAHIYLATSIFVNTPENVNVVEGEKLRIVCNAHGKPAPQIMWTVAEMNYTNSSGLITLQPDPEKNVPNAVLLIENVNMTDRGVYKCIGYSSITNEFAEDESMVRVKDKYAALWPFLGICLEVFVLCAIILIYEKKRNKSELEESDTDQSPDQKNTPDHGKESNLRHRQ